MNRLPPSQRLHRNQIPNPLPIDQRRQKIHFLRRIRVLPMAAPPRRPHHLSPMMPAPTQLHLHPPHPRRTCIHEDVIVLVIPMRLRHHKLPSMPLHHKLQLRQIPPILRMIPIPRPPNLRRRISPVRPRQCSRGRMRRVLRVPHFCRVLCGRQPALSLSKGRALDLDGLPSPSHPRLLRIVVRFQNLVIPTKEEPASSFPRPKTQMAQDPPRAMRHFFRRY